MGDDLDRDDVEIALDFAKGFKAELAKGAVSGWKYLRRSQQWKRRILRYGDRITQSKREHTTFLFGVVGSAMAELGYPEKKVHDFQVIATELTDNAFLHGCRSNRDKVRIEIELTAASVSILVCNPKGRRIPKADIEIAKSDIIAQKSLRPKVGLKEAIRLSDDLRFLKGRRRVKAIFYRNISSTSCYEEHGITYFSISTPFLTHIADLVGCLQMHPNKAVIIDLTGAIMLTSFVVRMLTQLVASGVHTICIVCEDRNTTHIARTIQLYLSPSETFANLNIFFASTKEEAKVRVQSGLET